MIFSRTVPPGGETESEKVTKMLGRTGTDYKAGEVFFMENLYWLRKTGSIIVSIVKSHKVVSLNLNKSLEKSYYYPAKESRKQGKNDGTKRADHHL
jgi:hypothetical protein